MACATRSGTSTSTGTATGCSTTTIARPARGKGDWPDPRPGWDRVHPDYDAWLANLRAERIQILVVARVNRLEGPHNVADPTGFPIERRWAESHPEVFQPLYGVAEDDPEMRIYRVRRPASQEFPENRDPRSTDRGRQVARIPEETSNDEARAEPFGPAKGIAMRLTLRTLLAWLDDTLPPSEVREIGRQVSESEFARDLVDRIRRVTRQRRLTVPAQSGPDAIDPNLVASYLDNELAPESVAEYEKLCLTSDVNLAEVASIASDPEPDRSEGQGPARGAAADVPPDQGT